MKTLICLDSGTTNTRGWLISGEKVLRRRSEAAGVRDTARTGTKDLLISAVRKVIEELCDQADAAPEGIIAAGMITSSLGIEEVAHVPAPAGINEIVGKVRRVDSSEFSELPLFLVPGISSGQACQNFTDLSSRDVMRGEETLVLGIAQARMEKTPFTVLNLGSHWKAITVGLDGRIESSVTSLAGELIHAAQSQTVIASALPKGQIAEADDSWVDAGMAEARRSGLTRGAFCVRLLEQAGLGTAEQRMSFLIGSFIRMELDALLAGGRLKDNREIVITGAEGIAACWERVLRAEGFKAARLNAEESESAYLAGLREIYDRLG